MNTGLLEGLGTSAGALADVMIPAGVIWEWAGDTLPDPAMYGRWIWADGSAVSRAEHSRLFKHVGVLHGAGNGTTTFNVPNRKGRTGVGYDAGDADFNAVGKTGGFKTTTADHSHSLSSHTHDLATHVHGLGGHAHGTNPHDHHLNGHGHTVNGHSHGGGTGVHAHNNANGTVYSTNNATHAHNGGCGQAAESPGTGAATGWGCNITTNSVGQGNSSESPGTDGNWGLTSGVWNSTANQGPTTGSDGASGIGAAQGPSTPNTGASSAGAASGNLQPYIAMNYIVKV